MVLIRPGVFSKHLSAASHSALELRPGPPSLWNKFELWDSELWRPRNNSTHNPLLAARAGLAFPTV